MGMASTSSSEVSFIWTILGLHDGLVPDVSQLELIQRALRRIVAERA
jgi:hypothetical protein